MKPIEYWDQSEVALYLQILGLKNDSFLENGIDGEMLLSLSLDDLTIELGLDESEAQKLLTTIEHSKTHASSGEKPTEKSEKEISELQEKIEYIQKKLNHKDEKIEELRKEMAELELNSESSESEDKPQAPRATAPPPPENPSYEQHENPPQQQQKPQGPGVVGGAAVGAAGGAVKGAIVGAILPGMDAGGKSFNSLFFIKRPNLFFIVFIISICNN